MKLFTSSIISQYVQNIVTSINDFWNRYQFYINHCWHKQIRWYPEDDWQHYLQMGGDPHCLQQRWYQHELSQWKHQSGGVGPNLQCQPEGDFHVLSGVCASTSKMWNPSFVILVWCAIFTNIQKQTILSVNIAFSLNFITFIYVNSENPSNHRMQLNCICSRNLYLLLWQVLSKLSTGPVGLNIRQRVKNKI